MNLEDLKNIDPNQLTSYWRTLKFRLSRRQLTGQIRRCLVSIITLIRKSIRTWATCIKIKGSWSTTLKMIGLSSARSHRFSENLIKIKDMTSRKEASHTHRGFLKIWSAMLSEVADRKQISTMEKCWWIEYRLLSLTLTLLFLSSQRQLIKTSMGKRCSWRQRL